MKKKYYKIVHIMFWFMIASIAALITLTIFSPNGGFIIIQDEKDELLESEAFIVKQIETVEQKVETEWYYFIATAYSADDRVQGTNSTTATGTEVREGIIAVDPDIIPLGTDIEIKGMGLFVAEDTGGKIKGNRIDIYFDSKEKAKEFGRQGIWIRFIDENLEVAGLLY